MIKKITLSIIIVLCIRSYALGQTEGDDCAWPFDAIIGLNTFDTSNASPSSPIPDDLMCDGTYLDWGTANPDIWFKFTPSNDGDHKFTTCDQTGFGNYDTSMVLYKTDCTNQVACNGDDPDGNTSCQDYYSTIEFTLTGGADYYIRIGGWQGDAGQGILTISESGGGDIWGACCLFTAGGTYYCYESTRDDCIAEGGEWTKGETCSEIKCGVVASSVWYVNANNTSPAGGTSWSTAFLDLQDALDVASSGNQIWVAQGTYYPSDTGGSNDTREAAYRLIAGVEIYGGFAGNETDVDQRQPTVNQVYLSGDLNGDDNGSGDNSENAYHVVLADNLIGLPPVLDSVYIRSGNANGSAPNQSGGALKVLNYQPGSTAFPLVHQTAFIQNEATQGGAIAISNPNASISLIRCVLANNTAATDGGAIRNNGNTAIDNCLLVANNARENGGAVYSNQGQCKLINSTIVQNSAGFVGGIYATAGTIIGTNNIIWGNEDENGIFSQLYPGGTSTWGGNYNCIQEYDFSLGGISNIDMNPRFIDEFGLDNVPGTGDENFKLFQLSPCIDAADNTVVYVEVDLIGNTRIVDDPYVTDTGNNPDELPGIVDMGAYERNQTFESVWIWTGNNSPYFNDSENWAQNGAPDSDSNVMFNGPATNTGLVIFDQTNYLNSLHVTSGTFEFNLNNNALYLRGASRALRVDAFDNNANAEFKGPGSLYVLNPLELSGGNISFRDSLDLYVDSLMLDDTVTFNYAGWVYGDVTNGGAVVLPSGRGIGNLDIDGSFYNRTNSNSGELVGTLSFDIAGYNSGLSHDHLSVSNSADMTTAIELRWSGEFLPNESDSFDLIDAGYSYGYPTLIFNTGLPSNLRVRWSNPIAGIRGGSEALLETTGPILFEDSSSYALTATPSEIVVADLDGDNDPDVAMAVPDENGGAGNVVILINDGVSADTWQVTELAPIPVGTNPIDIAVIDIDGDGVANDLVVANYESTSVTILTNDGSASFTETEITTDSSPRYLAVADYVTDGNDRDDIIVACDSFKISILQNTTALVGTQFNWEGSVSIPQPADILPGDVTNDKDFDFVLLSGAADEIRVLNGNGTGSYSPFSHVEVTNLPSGSDAAEFVALDFQTTRDGNIDIVTVNEGLGSISVLMGDGVTVGSASTTSVGTSPNEITVSDFDNDGDEDFVVSVIGSTDRELLIVRNDTEETVILSTGDSTATGDEPALVDHGDIDGDTLQDIICLIDLTPTGESSTPAIGMYFNTTVVVVDCPADLDGDGSVAVGDILLLIGAWGSAEPTYDLDGSGVVDVADILIVISAWGDSSDC